MSLNIPKRTPADDEVLVKRAQQDPQAFGEIFDIYYPAILGYVVRRTADIAVAEDITAEVFIKALRGIPRFDWRGFPVSSWLYKIAINELRMYYRKGKHTVSLEALQEATAFELPDERDMVEELVEAQTALERHELFMQANRALSMLPLKYQEALTLRFTEHKKVSEIAVILGKREGTVKSLLSRGLRMLREALATQQAANNPRVGDANGVQPFERPSIIPSEGHNYKEDL